VKFYNPAAAMCKARDTNRRNGARS